MKKIISILLIMIIITGCDMGKEMDNTPTKKVEAYLDSYQKLDDNVLNDLDDLVEDTEYSIEQKARYKEIFKKHYSNISYDIKNEVIDGDKAAVDAEIEVNDYSKILSESVDENQFKDENGVYNPSKYFDYQLDKLERATSKTKYTITFHLNKKDDEWVIEDLDQTSMDKIHGIYIK